MNKTEQETPFFEKSIKFRPHIVYIFFGPFNRPRRLLKRWHLFPFRPVYGIIFFLFIVSKKLNIGQVQKGRIRMYLSQLSHVVVSLCINESAALD